jgi:glutathione S-transferase
MKLLWSSRSPFARKVMVAAHELGLAARIETERVVVDSVNPNRDVMRLNPLSKIPTLLLDDGSVLFDSRVIVEYLADTAGDATLIPQGAARWTVLRRQALGDGVMEADLRWIDERNRAAALQLPGQIEASRVKINSGLDALEADDELSSRERVDIGCVAIGSALAHLDFRFAELEWRRARPRLAAWFETFSQRPSMTATAFTDRY